MSNVTVYQIMRNGLVLSSGLSVSLPEWGPLGGPMELFYKTREQAEQEIENDKERIVKWNLTQEEGDYIIRETQLEANLIP